MKTLIIFNPSIEDGGVEKNLFLISNYLADKIKNIVLISTSFKKKNLFSKKIHFSYIYFKFLENYKRLPKYYLCIVLLIFNIIKHNRKVVIFSFQANIYAIIIAKLFNIQVISRSNTAPAGWNKNFVKQKIFNFFFKKTELIIVNSYEFKKQMDKIYSIKSKVILNPFDFTYIKKKSVEKINYNFYKKNHLKLINVGRLVDQKDQLTILKAVHYALKNNKKVQLLIIGKGEKKRELEEYIKKNNLSKNIKLIGYKKNPFKYIRAADIFVLSSKFEGLPNVLIESIFLKRGIISSNCPTGPNEILKNGKYGNLFEIGDYKTLGNIIINYNKNYLKINAAYGICTDYSYEKNCHEYYKTVLPFLLN
jgi:glycosyltransferase involved in cell wall biosynthesis